MSSCPGPDRSLIQSIRSEFGYGSGRTRIELAMLNTVVFAPMEMASVTVAENASIRSRPSIRKAENQLVIASPPEDGRYFLRRYYFQLRVGTCRRRLVRAPSAKLRRVAEAVTLHVIVGHLHHQFRPQRLPREVFALAPAALPARHPLPRFRGDGLATPCGPRVPIQGAVPIWRQKLDQFLPPPRRKACAHADMVQHTRIVE